MLESDISHVLTVTGCLRSFRSKRMSQNTRRKSILWPWISCTSSTILNTRSSRRPRSRLPWRLGRCCRLSIQVIYHTYLFIRIPYLDHKVQMSNRRGNPDYTFLQQLLLDLEKLDLLLLRSLIQVL